MELRELALKVAAIAEEAGRHALQDQLNPHDLSQLSAPQQGVQFTSDIDRRLQHYIEGKIRELEPYQGVWRDRPDQPRVGERYWCVGGIDGVINFIRNMSEWAVTVSLFEVNEQQSFQPIMGVIYAPALRLTYLAARGEGAIRIRHTHIGEKREKIIPSTMETLQHAVVSFGMSYIPEESKRALHVVSAMAGLPADIKRMGPVSLDLCKVADGTYDAYFEPHLHRWDISAVSAGAVVVWEAQGTVCQWNAERIHWRKENDIVASNGLISEQLMPYLQQSLPASL